MITAEHLLSNIKIDSKIKMLSSILLCLISLKSISGLKTTINSNHFEATFEIKNLFYIEIEIKCSAANWCALGWGDEMTNADAILLLLKQDLITGP
jgi:hypothetical protein